MEETEEKVGNKGREKGAELFPKQNKIVLVHELDCPSDCRRMNITEYKEHSHGGLAGHRCYPQGC